MKKEMKAEELRCGNYVLYRGHFCQIEGVKTVFGKEAVYVLGSIYKISQFEPVPLTGDLLLRCGFGKEKEGHYSDRCSWDIHIGKDRIAVLSFQETDGKTWFLKYCSYLHELQNLYFALEGHELKVKS